jgi:TonB family protein
MRLLWTCLAALSIFVEPASSKEKRPAEPQAFASGEREGWALVMMRVKPDGSVEDALVVDSSGEPQFDGDVQRAVVRWKYPPLPAVPSWKLPAPFQGLDRCIKSRLTLGDQNGLVRPGFRERYDAARAALAESRFDDARAEHARLDARTVRELELRSAIEARIAEQAGDSEAEVRALGHALHVTTGSEEPSENTVLRRRRARVLADLGQFGAALGELRSLRDAGGLPPELESLWSELEARAGSRADISTPGVLRRTSAISDAPSIWMAPLLRDRFRIDSVSGKLDRIDVCCGVFAGVAKPGALTVLGGASTCQVVVRGEDGARLTLTELVAEPPPSPATTP